MPDHGVVIALICTLGILIAPIMLGFAFKIATTSKRRTLLMATMTEAAASIETAATSMNDAATALTAAAAKIGTLNDTSALTQPLADLSGAVTAVQTAAAAIDAAVNPPAQ
jgi:hypothetical protein